MANFAVFILLVPLASALGGVMGWCLCFWGPLDSLHLTGPALVGATCGTISALIAKASKMRLPGLLVVGFVLGAIPQILFLLYMRFFFTLDIGG
jgi:hypothetical protein